MAQSTGRARPASAVMTHLATTRVAPNDRIRPAPLGGYKSCPVRPARKTQKARTSGMYADESSPPASIAPKLDADPRPHADKYQPGRLCIVTRPKRRGSGSRGRGRRVDDDSDEEDDEDLESEEDVAAATTPSSAGNAQRGSPSNGYIDALLDSPESEFESEDVDMSDSPVAAADIELPATPSAAKFPCERTSISSPGAESSTPP
ncbi:hypothetical protein FRC06_011059, partial [Ceratobasidium sp. 370]